jgi:plasmid stability protein
MVEKDSMMAELILTDLHDDVLRRLEKRATRHGRTLADEAKAILADELYSNGADVWAPVDTIYHRLAASAQTFSDSGHLLREDRDRCEQSS